jgi:hypothetical protein
MRRPRLACLGVAFLWPPQRSTASTKRACSSGVLRQGRDGATSPSELLEQAGKKAWRQGTECGAIEVLEWAGWWATQLQGHLGRQGAGTQGARLPRVMDKLSAVAWEAEHTGKGTQCKRT